MSDSGWDDAAVERYLHRIGVPWPAKLDAAALRRLQQAHLRTVPFENLSIHLPEPISLAPADLLAKITERGRGGFCYELNGAFALLLEALGARVRRLAARVYQDGAPGPPYDHLALAVDLPGGSGLAGEKPAPSLAGEKPDGSGTWLADVGFGSHAIYPLRYGSRVEQDDPAGRFRLAETSGGDLDVLKDGKPEYLLETRERELADFAVTCWYQQTAPQSPFRRGTICTRLTGDGGRITISGHQLIRTTPGGERTEEELPAATLLAAYREHFGIELDRLPAGPAATEPYR